MKDKTPASQLSVEDFINGIEHEARRNDTRVLVDFLKDVTEEEPTMWGPSIIGFGLYKFQYSTGKAGKWFYAGFSPSKETLSIYIMSGLDPNRPISPALGKFKQVKGCIYVKRLSDINLKTLGKLVSRSMDVLKEKQRQSSYSEVENYDGA